MDKPKTRSAKRVNLGKAVATKAKEVLTKSVGVKSAKKVKPEEFVRLVEKKAYEIYVNRGYSNGNDMGDWLEAERFVKAELGL